MLDVQNLTKELKFKGIRSGGAGGQHVNKVSSKIELTFNISTSKVLSEERELLIHLPDDYEKSEKKYPVIYVLDGNGHFKHATTAITYLKSQNHMPAAILIGITNKSGMRNRDLGDGNSEFWTYIKSEVVSFVENNYRTSGHKTIFGHSMAGAFVMRRLGFDSSFGHHFRT